MAFEALTKQWLTDVFLVGIRLTDGQNVPFPDVMYTHAIASAIESVANDLKININLETVSERHDYRQVNAQAYHRISLEKRPVREVTGISIRYGNAAPQTIPVDWAVVDRPFSGNISIMPNAVSGQIPAMMMYGMGFQNFQTRRFVPGWWTITYISGFDDDNYPLPAEIVDLIGIRASLLVLDITGDLIAGPGIASKSVSIPGTSVSVSTTASATNSGYGARMIQEQKRYKMVLDSCFRKYNPMNVGVI